MQDEIQSYHWSKEQCTLDPLVVYFIDGDGNTQHNSHCLISGDNNHDKILFIKYKQSLLITLEKTFQLWTRSSISDGCAEQYKNHKNFINLCVIISKISIWMLNGYSLQLIMARHHTMVLGDLLNVMLRNVVYKDPYMTKF